MKPVLIQTLHKHNQKVRGVEKNLALPTQAADALYKGRRDQSGFIVGLAVFLMITIALAMS